MATVILVRHGETDLNRKKVFRGRVDVPLNDNGRRQAECAARRLADWKIDAVYSSPLCRATETAAITAGPRGLAVDVVPGLTDMSYGDWEGMGEEAVRERYPELFEQLFSRPEAVVFPNGESLGEVRKRVMRALAGLLRKNQDRVILLSCHRVVNKVMLCAVLGKTNRFFWNIKQDNCCINVFSTGSRGYVIELLNDTSHLKDVDVLKSDF